jgi:putative tryptophan/tyrosine transport system substrate-binding protein
MSAYDPLRKSSSPLCRVARCLLRPAILCNRSLAVARSMRRREVISLFGGAAAATALSWPLGAHAQQPPLPVIGYLNARSPENTANLLPAFKSGLAQNGFVEGQNVAIEYRWARGQYDRLPAMAAELVAHPVSLLVTTGGEPAAFAASRATSTTPIVFTIGGDPAKEGLVKSFSQPGGNATGITLLTNLLERKRFSLLRELVPPSSTIAVLYNPKFSPAAQILGDVQAAAKETGMQINVLQASTDGDLDAAFEAISQQHFAALATIADPFFDTRREKITAAAARCGVPAIYHAPEYVLAGGLMSYGIDFPEAYRLTGVYAGRILKGAKPADLPIMQATKFQMVINLKTAKALGIKISDNLLSLVDEVVE